MEAILASIQARLTQFSEQYLSDVIDQDKYAFCVHDLLGDIPTPAAPRHLPVLRAVKQWKADELITAEQAVMLQSRIIAASKEHAVPSDAGASTSQDDQPMPDASKEDMLVGEDKPLSVR